MFAGGAGGDLIGAHLEIVRQVGNHESHLGAAFGIDGDPLHGAVELKAVGGIIAGERHTHQSCSVGEVDHFGHHLQAVAVAKETGYVGLHHKGLLGDKSTVEGADFQIVGKRQSFDIPTGKQLGNTEAVDSGASGVGMQVGDEKSQIAEVGANLHGLGGFLRIFVGVPNAPHRGHNGIDRIARHGLCLYSSPFPDRIALHGHHILGGHALTGFSSSNLYDRHTFGRNGNLVKTKNFLIKCRVPDISINKKILECLGVVVMDGDKLLREVTGVSVGDIDIPLEATV